ncbi:MAG TPA: class I SAM-dependent methyltransferase [Burkholderiales bacterium]|nr:class I SAM-dependent methyltransferase [Burkholderiales bacterium]
MGGHQSEDLEQAAALARAQAEALCRRDPRTGISCSWHHGFWPTLRLLGLVTEPALHGAFLRRALAAIPAARPRVLISGTADHALLAQALAAFGARPFDAVVLDLCETPLMLNRWFAGRAGFAIETRQSNILDFSDDRPYDAVCTHAFLGNFDPAQRAALAAKWRALLRPGGRVVTVNRLRPGSEPLWIAFSTDQVWAFRERVEDAAKARGLRFPRLGRAAEAYAGRQAVYPLGTAEELRALFEQGGFDIEELSLAALDPAARQALGVPAVPGGDSYAQLVAVRR